MNRVIGIRHRIKKTATGEARPTQLYLDGNIIELEDDNAELDWVRGTFPIDYRAVEPDEDLSALSPRHIKWRSVKKDEKLDDVNPAHLRVIDGKQQVAIKVPATFDGLKPRDVYAMSLGGSGDRLAFALSKAGEKMGAIVLRLPPSVLKERRGDGDKDQDAKLLAELAQTEPDLFHEVTANTRTIILVRETQALRMDAMKARIACEQRLRQTLIGQVFCREGDFAELDIEAQFEKLKANDRILSALVEEETVRIRELDRAIKQTGVWQHILEGVTGIGPALAGRLISSIGGIERFMVEPDQERMDALYEESVRLEREGGLQDLKRFVKDEGNAFQTLQRAASWCGRNGRAEQAAKLERAVQCHEERSKLRHKARKATQAKLKKFCGVAVMEDGKFPRRRAGSVANWHPDARQALYLLADQFNRQSDRTRWGKLLLEYKVKLRAAHPDVLEVDGKKRYTDGHIHKMALWRTVTKFVEWLADEWSNLARRQKLQAARKRVA
jgi:hypothetical protein